MHYLGGLCGIGTLACQERTVAVVEFDFDGFAMKAGRAPERIMVSGEIRAPAAALLEVFGRKNITLVTEDGRRLHLSFSEKRLPPTVKAAHVDVAGDLPQLDGWGR